MILLLSGFFYCLSLKASGLVNINTAGLEELDALPGIGPAKAQAIIDYRTANGNFLAPADIMQVPGIGAATYEGLKDLITVGGNEEGGTENGNEIIASESEEEICGNRMIEGLEECDDGNILANDGCDSVCRLEAQGAIEAETKEEKILIEEISAYKLGDIVINELVSDPADGDTEWIELYNNLKKEVSLIGWTIEDGSGAKTALTGSIGASGSEKYYILEKPKGNLNNGGDLILLRYQAILIDTVAYGKWDDGDMANNAPAAADPLSTARNIDGHNTYHNKNDFSQTAQPTKKSGNIISAPETEEDEISAIDRSSYDFSDDIIISEIFPNPAGDDSQEEFIELYNAGARDIDLSEWRLGDESAKRYTIESGKDKGEFSTIIKAKGYWVIKRALTKIALNNSSDAVMLYQPFKDKPCASVRYEKSFEGQSYNYIEKNKYAWSETTSPGQANIIKVINHAPTAAFDCPARADLGRPLIFDSSDSLDEDGGQLFYFWDFGDGATNTLPLPEHTYFKAGAFTVLLKVSDGELSAQAEKIIVIKAPDKDGQDAENESGGAYGIILNEIMPNPAGDDSEEEFIEIYNRGNTRVNLLNWRVDDMEGGSKPYVFKTEFMLDAGRYFLLERIESKLSLNNADDKARLFNPNGEIADEIAYGKTAQGEAYARGANDKWFWTTVPTPGEENVISVKDSKLAPSESGVIVKGISLAKDQADSENFSMIALEEINKFEIGDKVQVAGTVAVLPGVLGAQFFYIVATSGVQVYNYKKDFPDLKIGDYAEVRGELAESGGERRLKTKTADDITIIKHEQAPSAVLETCENIGEELVGRLITVSGDVVDRKSATVYLDDGTGEVKIYIKNTTGIVLSEIKEGAKLAFTGIVGRTSAGIRLLPRGAADIANNNIEQEEISAVLGEVAVKNEWELAARDKKMEMLKYLLALSFGLIAVLSGVLFKLKRG